MKKKKILIHTNPPWLKTGLAENGREIAKYLHKTGKYEIVYYCSQTNSADPILSMMPWKCYGAIPNDPQTVNQINQNPGLARDVAYGSHYIEEIIKNEKPDIYLGSDDIWGFSLNNYCDKKWWNKLTPFLHITIDSLPILGQAFDQAKKTKNYITWARFAEKEMKRFGEEYKNVQTVYGAINTQIYSPITKAEKSDLRRKFGLRDKTKIIGFVFRNQLRKRVGALLKAFSEFKKENPLADVKLHLHTSYSEKQNGWDIPKLISFFEIDPKDVLCTYVCRNCGQWDVRPYEGEDINCHYCGAEKSKITPNIVNGVPHEEMRLVYGLWDAGVNIHTSGGLEYNCLNTLLCGLPLAVTNYASGQDFCEQPFVTALNFETDFEPGTSFVKSATSINAIKGFIKKICHMSVVEQEELGRKGRNWALKTFDTNVIGAQWERLFDQAPFVDWSDFSFENEEKNYGWQLPPNFREMPEDDFIIALYKNILKAESPDQDGFQNWKAQIKNGVPREQIYNYFIKIAFEDSQKNKKVDFWDLIDKNRKNKRCLFLLKESLGDSIIATQLFDSFHEQYPNHDLYVACDLKFASVYEGNPNVYKVLPYQNFMESEMAMIGAGQNKEDCYFHVFFHPAIMAQRQLQYLNINNIAHNLKK